MNKVLQQLIVGMLLAAPIALAGDHPATAARPADETLTLQAAVKMALARAPEIYAAQALAARAGAAVRETRSLNLPQVVAGSGLAYNNGFPLSMEGAAPSLVQVGMSQSIFSKKNQHLIREAEESSKASQFAPESVRNELAARTALVYSELHQARKAARLWSARLEAAVIEQRLAETLLEAGRARPLDLTLARTTASAARHQALVAAEQARLAEVELRELIGISEGSPLRTADPQLDTRHLEESSESLHRRALETLPEIRQAEALMRAKQHHVEAEKADKQPRYELISQYALFSRTNNYQDFFNRFTRNNFIAGLSIQVPIFSGDRTGARVAQSQQELAEARYRLERMKTDLKISVERSGSALRIARNAAELAASEVKAAEESVRIQEALLEVGRVSPKEIESSRNQLREKQLAALEAEKALFQKQIDFLRTTGTLTAVF